MRYRAVPPAPMNAQPKAQVYFFFALFGGILVLTFFLFLPYLTALAVAAVFAALTYPVHTWMRAHIRFAGLAALATTFLMLLVVATPLTVLGTILFGEARDLAFALNRGDATLQSLVAPIEGYVQRIYPDASLNVDTLTRETVGWLTRNLGSAFSSTAHALLAFVIGVIAYFFFLLDGRSFLRALVRFSPLDDAYDNQILGKLEHTIHSVITGALAIALIQGVLAGLGMFLFGVPKPVLGGAVAAIGGLLPGIGTGIALVPAVAYLIITEQIAQGIGLAIWGLVIVGLVDNILLPKLMSRNVSLHPLFILLSVLGGISLFGAAGILLGPLIISLLYALGDIYFSFVAPAEEQRPKEQPAAAPIGRFSEPSLSNPSSAEDTQP